MLFLKLIIRGLLRHQKRGIKLFVFITLCVTAIIFSLSFKESFHQRYLEQITLAYVGHIRIVAKDSIKINPKSDFGLISDKISIINVDSEMESFIKNIDGVKASTQIVDVGGEFFTIDSEMQGEGNTITGINPDELFTVLPGIIVNEGIRDFSNTSYSKDIPMLRCELNPWDDLEKESNTVEYNFARKDFRISGNKLEIFKKQMKDDFPGLFNNDIEGIKGTDYFIEALNNAILKKDLSKQTPSKYLEPYNWQIDDIITKIESLEEKEIKEISKCNKKLFNLLYPKQIAIIKDYVSLNKQMTLLVSASKKVEVKETNKIIPVKFVGFAKGIPLYSESSYIDINVIKKYLDLNKEECTDYIIRLKNVKLIPIVKEKIEKYLKQRNLPYIVADYKKLGSIVFPTITAFDIIFTIIIALFLLTITFFIINLVLLSIIKRKKEIGTSFAIGMTKVENIFIILGEVFVIITLSWIFGSIISSFLILLFSKTGLPGMIFFNTEKLFFIFDIKTILSVYLFILPISILASFIPSLSILKLKPVEILRETN